MDPDKTLKEIRELLDGIIESDPDTPVGDLHGDAQALANRIEALDNWIKRGGSLPREWRVGR